jgi:hypothetical protein
MEVLTSVVGVCHVSASKLVEVFSISSFMYCFKGHAVSRGQVPILMAVRGGKKRAPFTEHSGAVITCDRL